MQLKMSTKAADGETTYARNEDYSPQQLEPASEAEDFLLTKYFTDTFPHQYILDSYDDFIDTKIPECMAAMPIDIGNGVFAKVNLLPVGKPFYIGTDSAKYPLHPKTALSQQSTYGVELNICVNFVNSKGKVLKKYGTSENLTLMREMFVLVYSKHCWKHDKIKHNKSPVDPGCYAIINGKMHVILLFEKSRYNQYFIGMDKDKKTSGHLPYISHSGENAMSSYYASIHMFRGSEAKHTARYSLVKFDQGRADWEAKKDAKKFGAKKPKVVLEGINVIAMIYVILHCKAEREYTSKRNNKYSTFVPPNTSTALDTYNDIAKKFIPREQLSKCELAIAATKAEFNTPLSVESILTSFYQCLGILTASRDEARKRELTYQYIKQRVFPALDSLDDKISMIVTMSSTLFQHRAGYVPLTDTGHWGTMSLWAAGSVLLKIFRKKFSMLARHVRDSENPKTTPSEVASIIKTYDFETKFMTEFRALPVKGGFKMETKSQGPKDKAVSILVTPLNNSDLRSMLTKTRNNVSKNTHLYRPRGVEGSFYAFICGHFTREDTHCGLTKWTAMTAISTLGCTDKQLRAYIRILKVGYTDEVKQWKFGPTVKSYTSNNNIPVLVHGSMIGHTTKVGIKNMILMKRYGIIDRMCSIVYHADTKKCVELAFDANRLVIPVVVVNALTGRPKLEDDRNWKTRTFTELVERGMIQYLDNYEIENIGEYAINLAQSFSSFDNIKKDVLMLELAKKEAAKEGIAPDNPYIVNIDYELNNIKKNMYNYALLHPIAAYGLVTAMGQFVNGNQPCRTGYATKHTAQDIANVLNNPYLNMNRLTAMYGTRSRVRSFIHEAMGLSEDAPGQTITLVFTPQYNNQEDSCVLSRAAVESGKFTFVNTKIISETLDQDDQKFARFILGNISPYRFRLLDESGFPAVGMFANPGDVIIGKVRTEVGGTPMPMNVILEKNEYGFIEEVVVVKTTKSSSSTNQQLTVNVRLSSQSATVVGGKVRTPHAQKFIVSAVRNPESMPWFPDSGTISEIMLSTASIPTRMTIGSLLEPLLQLASVLEGKVYDTSGFKDFDIVKLKDVLRRHGFRDDGTHRVNDPYTGKRFTGHVFSGPARIMMLARIAEDQVQCRTIGKKNKRTGQAESARSGDSRDKGQKFGEMERIQCIKYGAFSLITERMNISCDNLRVVVCKDCHEVARFNGELGKFSCPNCGIAAEGLQCKDQFGEVMGSQSAIVLELLSETVGVKIRTRYGTEKEFLNITAGQQDSLDDTSDTDTDSEKGSDESESADFMPL